MIAYVGQSRAKKLNRRLLSLGIRECTIPSEWPPRRLPYFLDNGAYPAFTSGEPWDEAAFVEVLDLIRASSAAYMPDFVVAPDVVGGGRDSLRLSLSWLERLGGIPAYLAVQDGMTEKDVRKASPGFAGLFVGGTLGWKLETGGAWAKLAQELGLPCHIGRVGTGNRVRWALDCGVNSIDSCLPLWSEEKLRIFTQALATADQKQLFRSAQ